MEVEVEEGKERKKKVPEKVPQGEGWGRRLRTK